MPTDLKQTTQGNTSKALKPVNPILSRRGTEPFSLVRHRRGRLPKSTRHRQLGLGIWKWIGPTSTLGYWVRDREVPSYAQTTIEAECDHRL